MEQGNLEAALSTYMDALEHSPDNPDILTTLGITFLRLGDNQRAFDSLGSSLLHDPRNPRTLLAVGSIIQVCSAWPAPLTVAQCLLQLQGPLARACNASHTCANTGPMYLWQMLYACRTTRTWMWRLSSTGWLQLSAPTAHSCGTT